MGWETTRKQILELCGRKDTPWLIVRQPVEMLRLDCSEMQVRHEDPLEAVDRSLLRLAEINPEGITSKDAHELLGLGPVLSFLLLIRLEKLGLLRMQKNSVSPWKTDQVKNNAKSQAYRFSFVPTSDPKVEEARFFIETKGLEALRINMIVEMNIEPVTIYYWAHPLRIVPDNEVPPDIIYMKEPPHFFMHALTLNPDDLIPQSDKSLKIPGMPLSYCGPTDEAISVIFYVIGRRNKDELTYPSWFYFTVSGQPEDFNSNFFHEIWQKREYTIERFNDESVLSDFFDSLNWLPAEIGEIYLDWLPKEIGQSILTDWIKQKVGMEELGDVDLSLHFGYGYLRWSLDKQFLECWLEQPGQPLLKEEAIWISGRLGYGQWAECKTKLIPKGSDTAQLWFKIILKETIRKEKVKAHDFGHLCDKLRKKWSNNWNLQFITPTFEEFLTFLWVQQEYELVYQLREEVDLPYDGTTANST